MVRFLYCSVGVIHLNFRTIGLFETEVCDIWENNTSHRVLLFFLNAYFRLDASICSTALALVLNLKDSSECIILVEAVETMLARNT